MQKENLNARIKLKGEMKMKVMTFNIQSGFRHPDNDIYDLDFCSKVIEKYNPDIVGLNEVHNSEDYGHQVEILAKKSGFPYYYFGKAIERFGSKYGNAFMSKFPIKDIETIIIPDPVEKNDYEYFETRCIIKAVVDCGCDVTFMVSHFGLAKQERINAVQTVCDLLGKNPEKSVIMGDYNTNPDHEVLAPIYNVMKDTAQGKNFLTFPADAPVEKLDYIFVSDDIKISDVYVAPEIGSDHCAYIAEIEF